MAIRSTNIISSEEHATSKCSHNPSKIDLQTIQPGSGLEATNLLIIIDANVEDYQILADGVVNGATVFILDRDRDGIEQISEALQQHSSITSLHIVSHGSPGCLYLGNTELSLDTLDRYTSQLKTWFPSSPLLPNSSSPQLLLYGCNVAAGDAGVEFIEKLHKLTGATIAASAKPTGSAVLGGTWELEITTGQIQSPLAFQPEAMSGYGAIMALSVSQNSTASSLLSILQGNTTGLSNFTATITGGSSTAFGQFSGGGPSIGMDSGIVLSTGNATDVDGANTASNTSTNLPLGVGTDNGGISGAYDFTELTITFTSDGTASNLYFQYLFGSEEFPEYGGTAFNDRFDLQFNGTELGLLSNGQEATINNLLPNGTANPPNGGVANSPSVYMASAHPDYIDNPFGANAPYSDVALDGFTKPLTATGNLVVGTNTLKIRIYDIADAFYDSAVFIKAQSISTFPPGSATAITAAEESAETPLGLGKPTDAISTLNSNNLTITISSIPTLGVVKKADGSTVNVGDTLTETELVGLKYDAPLDYDGTANPGDFTFNVTDGTISFNGLTDITLTPINDVPTLDLNGSGTGVNYSTTFTEGNNAVPIADSTATINDPDGTDINTLTLSITGLADGTDESLTIGGQSVPLINGTTATTTVGVTTFSIQVNSSTVSVTKQGGGDIPTADLQTLLQGITYQNNSEAPTGGDRVITVKVNDGTVDSNLATSTITVIPQNDTPVLDLNGSGTPGNDYSTSFTEGSSAVSIADSSTALGSDPDGTDIQTLTLSFTGLADGASEVLNVGGQAITLTDGTTGTATVGGTTFSISMSGSTVTITKNGGGDIPNADVQALLRNITYQNNSNAPTGSNRTISITANDGILSSNTVTSIITITPQNDPPALDLNGGIGGTNYSNTFTENGSPAKLTTSTATATDPDGTDIETLTLSIAGLADGTNEILTIGGQPVTLVDGISTTATVGSTTFNISVSSSTLTITKQGGGAIPDADVQTLLRSIAYQNNSEAPTAGNRIITIKANDGTVDSNIATSTIAVQPQNDPPAVDLNGGGAGTNHSATFTENGSAVNIADNTNATVSDPDGTDIATLTLSITGLSDGASEILSIGGQTVALTNGTTATATVGGTTFSISISGGTVSISKQGGGDIPNADLQSLLRGITYQNTSEAPTAGDRVITVKANDGTVDSNLATSTITVTPVNDVPVANSNAITVAEVNDSHGCR
jgi:Domain of unknown function (DUF4347)